MNSDSTSDTHRDVQSRAWSHEPTHSGPHSQSHTDRGSRAHYKPYSPAATNASHTHIPRFPGPRSPLTCRGRPQVPFPPPLGGSSLHYGCGPGKLLGLGRGRRLERSVTASAVDLWGALEGRPSRGGERSQASLGHRPPSSRMVHAAGSSLAFPRSEGRGHAARKGWSCVTPAVTMATGRVGPQGETPARTSCRVRSRHRLWRWRRAQGRGPRSLWVSSRSPM